MEAVSSRQAENEKYSDGHEPGQHRGQKAAGQNARHRSSAFTGDAQNRQVRRDRGGLGQCWGCQHGARPRRAPDHLAPNAQWVAGAHPDPKGHTEGCRILVSGNSDRRELLSDLSQTVVVKGFRLLPGTQVSSHSADTGLSEMASDKCLSYGPPLRATPPRALGSDFWDASVRNCQ